MFESLFKKECDDYGFAYIDLSYHHNLSDTVSRRLHDDSTPSCLALRTSPDFLLLTEKGSLYVELKTGGSADKMFLEAYPLMCNQIREKEMGCPCLYLYNGAFSDYKVIGCYASDIIPDTVVIPDIDKNKSIEGLINQYFSPSPIEKRHVRRGFSGDAHVVLRDLSAWKDWDALVKDLT